MLRSLFYDGLDQKTSVYLFGSAATGHWVRGKSDLDLVVLAPKVAVGLFANKVREWQSIPAVPKLDGFLLTSAGRTTEAIHIETFERINFPSGASIALTIDLIDQWNIRNHSQLLFGNPSLNGLIREISQNDLKNWALGRMKAFALNNPNGTVSDNVELSNLFWSVSYAARILMLSRGVICESKVEALQWLATQYSEIRSLVDLLLIDDAKSEISTGSITSKQGLELRRFCLALLIDEVKNTSAGGSSVLD